MFFPNTNQVKSAELEKCLTQRSIMTTRESVTKALTMSQAVDGKDAFVKVTSSHCCCHAKWNVQNFLVMYTTGPWLIILKGLLFDKLLHLFLLTTGISKLLHMCLSGYIWQAFHLGGGQNQLSHLQRTRRGPAVHRLTRHLWL